MCEAITLTKAWDGHREQDWQDPFTFKTERFLDNNGELVLPDHPNRKLFGAFGRGSRVCIGESFAINRLFMFITCILQQFHVEAENSNHLPSCDPRDYGFGLTFTVPEYNIKFVPRTVHDE